MSEKWIRVSVGLVQLVIFIITTTPIVNDLDVDLPSAAKRPKDPKAKVNYVTVESTGRMYLNKDEVNLAALQDKLIGLRLEDPDLNVVIRGSGRTKYQRVVSVMDVLQQVNIGKVNLATEPYPDGTAKKD